MYTPDQANICTYVYHNNGNHGINALAMTNTAIPQPK